MAPAVVQRFGMPEGIEPRIPGIPRIKKLANLPRDEERETKTGDYASLTRF
jgi:hypothetical protein